MNFRNRSFFPCFVGALLLSISMASYGQSQQNIIEIPEGIAITIDGKILKNEWQDAYREKLVGGGELLLKHDGEHLCLAIKGLEQGWSHVYVIQTDAVYILHASAALGTAIYKKSGADWQPTQGFSWSLRDTSQSDKQKRARLEFLKANSWVASNMDMGTPAELEFKIGGKFLKANSGVLAVVYASEAESPQYWPESLTDDTLKQDLIFGNTPENLKFDFAGWAKVKLNKT